MQVSDIHVSSFSQKMTASCSFLFVCGNFPFLLLLSLDAHSTQVHFECFCPKTSLVMHKMCHHLSLQIDNQLFQEAAKFSKEKLDTLKCIFFVTQSGASHDKIHFCIVPLLTFLLVHLVKACKAQHNWLATSA